MKALFTIVILFCITSASLAQRVASSCDAPDSVKTLYAADAADLAYDYQISLNASYKDSTIISRSLQDTFLRALIAVYNAVQLPDAKSVTRIGFVHDYDNSPKPIHDHTHPCFDTIWLESLDTTIDWVKNLFHRQIPTGNASIDSLIQVFGIMIVHAQEFNGFADVMLHTTTYYNTQAIANRFNKIIGNDNAYLIGTSGSNADAIQQKLVGSEIKLTFMFGFGDCPSGCIGRDYWYFSVFPDCSVSFDGAEDVKAVANEINRNFIIYPNPASGIITIETQAQNMIEILDLQGKVLTKVICVQEKTEITISSFPKGTYFVRIESKSGEISSAKFIKE